MGPIGHFAESLIKQLDGSLPTVSRDALDAHHSELGPDRQYVKDLFINDEQLAFTVLVIKFLQALIMKQNFVSLAATFFA